MALALYKPGQGYWTRMLTAVGAGMLVLGGLAWILPQFDAIREDATRLTFQAALAVGVVVIFGGLGWYLLNKPNIVDFLIATEAEMRKVNWPSRREIIGSTWIVICGTAMMTLFLWLINLGFAWLFQRIGVL